MKQKRLGKRIAAWFLCLAMVLTAINLPGFSSTVNAAEPIEVNSWATLKDAISNVNDGDIIKLSGNVVATETDSAIDITSHTFTLDLNGYTINRNLTSAKLGGCVFWIWAPANMTIIDSSEAKTGTITGGFNDSNGGAIGVEGGTLKLLGGTITGNKTSRYGGGIFAKCANATLILGGTAKVVSNAAQEDGDTEVTSNIHLNDNRVDGLKVGTGEEVLVPGTAQIGIRFWLGLEAAIPDTICDIPDEATANCFEADNDGYAVFADNTSGSYKLVIKSHDHTYNGDTCQAICTVCGKRNEAGTHTWSSEACSAVCTVCGTYRPESAHSFDTNDTCTVCGIKKVTFKSPGVYVDNQGLKYENVNGKICAGINETYLSAYTEVNVVVPSKIVCDGLTYDVILTELSSGFFRNCTKLKEIELSEGFTNIPSSAFAGCSNLTSVTLPDTLTTIGSFAFEDCSNLTSVTLPDSVTSFGVTVFKNCSNLESLSIPCSIDATTNFGCNISNITQRTHKFVNKECTVCKIKECVVTGDHDFSKLDNTKHKCSQCGLEVEHSFGDYQDKDGKHYQVCSDCGAETTHTAHTYTAVGASSSGKHKCSVCGVEKTHVFSNGTCQGVCSDCGVKNANGTHDYSVYVSNGDGTHKIVCKGCEKVQEGHGADSCSGGTATCQAKAICNLCKAAYGSKTDHNYRYTAAKNVLTVSCTTTGCTESYSLTLNASSAVYSGSVVEATIVTTGWAAAGFTVPEIVYEAKDGSSLTDGKAVNLGDYIAKITVEGVTAQVSFSIVDSAEKAAVYDVIEKIDAIGTVAYTNACKAKIDAARSAYDALSATQKSQVTNYATLTAAEAEYARLKPVPGPSAPGKKYSEVVPSAGTIKDITSSGEATAEINPYSASIINSSALETLVKVTAEEKAQGVNVWIKIVDASSTMSATDKAAIQGVAGDYTIGMYLDATLFKKVGTGTPTKVSDLNGKIKISLVIPENLRKEGRTFEIIRVHNGTPTVIQGTYDATTYTFTFETDQFSSYAIAYKDNGSNNGKDVTAPKTGDPYDSRVWYLLLIASFGGMLVLGGLRRKDKVSK